MTANTGYLALSECARDAVFDRQTSASIAGEHLEHKIMTLMCVVLCLAAARFRKQMLAFRCKEAVDYTLCSQA